MATDEADGSDPIRVTTEIRLRRVGPEQIRSEDLQALLPCYKDRETVRMVDGPNAEPYDLPRLQAMVRYMAEHGEFFMIERLTSDHAWMSIGDAGLQARAVPIVLAPAHRRQGIGRAVLRTLIDRAREQGWRTVEVSEIYDYNVASRRTYASLGFVAVEQTDLGHRYRLNLT